MKEFDRQICLHNIAFLVKKKKIALKDLETAAGVSVGYFSRLNKPGATATPSIEVIHSVAQQLDVSIDLLVHTKLYQASSTEEYILDFVDHALQKTAARKMIWENYSNKPAHTVSFVQSLFGVGGPEGSRYHSRFFPNVPASIDGDIFGAALSERAELYLIPVTVELLSGRRSGHELYMRVVDKVHPICCFAQPQFEELLSRLQKAAALCSQEIRLDDSVVDEIDRFMEDAPFEGVPGGPAEQGEERVPPRQSGGKPLSTLEMLRAILRQEMGYEDDDEEED